jgi:hypothetical protein
LIEVRDKAGVTRNEWERVIFLQKRICELAREEGVSLCELILCVDEALI